MKKKVANVMCDSRKQHSFKRIGGERIYQVKNALIMSIFYLSE